MRPAAARVGTAAEPAAPATLRRILDGASHEALTDFLLRRAKADPDLASWIEIEFVAVPDGGAVDPAPITARARAILARRRENGRDDYEAHGLAAELRELVNKAAPFLDAGDGRKALTVLMAVAEPLAVQWHGYADWVGEGLYTLFRDLTEMMAEAVLVGDLTGDEREALRGTIEDWASDFNDYAPEGGFVLVTAALAAGWDDPALRVALSGGTGAELPKSWQDRELITLRLRVLAAADRTDEYLNLSRAAGDHAAHAGMLVRLGRIDEAVAYAAEHVIDLDRTLALAKGLHAAGHPDQAFAVAQAGLERAGPERSGLTAALACWLRDEATARKRPDLALEAARTAFAQSLALADYEAARTIAGKAGWDPVRDDLLTVLAKADYARDRIAILLEEGLVGDAMAAAEGRREGHADEAVLMRLAEAALARDPAWVVRFAEAKAKPLLTQNPGTYAQAAAWLAHAKQGYLARGQQMAWAARIGDLIAENKRRYKLKPLLEALR